jgi:hypothetical protein
MPRTKKKDKDPEAAWATSKARKLLKDDIITGKVKPNMDADQVYATREEFQKFPMKRFKPNLENLRIAIARDYKRMCSDCEYYGHDIGLLLVLRENKNESVQAIAWHKSEAKALLEKDIKNKVHLKIMENKKKISPKEIYKTRVEYRAFPLAVFRNHIYQEVKRLEKIESKIRYNKKKKRCPASAALPHLIEMIGDHDQEADRK